MPAGPPPTMQHEVEVRVGVIASSMARSHCSVLAWRAFSSGHGLPRPAGPPTLRHPVDLEPLMGWHGHLQLDYRRAEARTVLQDRHEGPLRVLRSLYPEGHGICHNVLVHPPGGLVGGDTLAIDATLAPQSHALITTAGATRFYRSTGPAAVQRVSAHVEADARLEWLPLETIAFSGCNAESTLRFDLDVG